ncbi:methyl-accepting chemotaxis protein [Aquincola tertiaricarbonis]|uniref:methyl-accepting chemotaxis protein n=1 Tax=Aquincola tertiaricarbonis TaxID=391953 RepID=UPI0028739F7C|nr:methyl-accepting chemotaxis protein [Aquincola tertiaricarbonis]
MKTSSLSLRAKLAAAFGVLAVLVAVVSALAVTALGRSDSHFETFVTSDSARIQLANNLRAAAANRAISARNMVLVTSAEDGRAEAAAVQQAHGQVQSALEGLRERMTADSDVLPAERERFDRLADVEKRYSPVALRVVALASGGQQTQAVQVMNQECRPLLAELQQAVDDYLKVLGEGARQGVAEARDSYAHFRTALIAAGVVALGSALAFLVLITRQLHRALGAEPAALGAVAERVARGDLGAIEGAEQAPPASVLASLSHMQRSLAGLVAEVRSASEAIAIGSTQIATGNADLSRRTEQQASSLQETAASMEQMTATVSQSAETAHQATQLAAGASGAAAKGGEVVARVVSTMEDISSSSRRIGDIIGTIDGIAFQTNILALNAAVEAARAGEQGRGFAVVAGEVRTLAQRSAEAAKEIKTLIGASVERVEAGTRLVAEAGSTMEDIVAQVQRVSALIGDISRSGQEQTTGISQVSQAVNQLDQVTQQNASLVEQSAAAAESLQRQAQQLTEVVRVFRVQEAVHG